VALIAPVTNLMFNICGLSKMSQTVTVSYFSYPPSRQLKAEEKLPYYGFKKVGLVRGEFEIKDTLSNILKTNENMSIQEKILIVKVFNINYFCFHNICRRSNIKAIK
jgi:hypothetical protein